MPAHFEIERRFIAPIVIPPPGASRKDIVQGYFPTPAHQTTRIRRIDGVDGTYVLTTKKGNGIMREEKETVIPDRDLGRQLLAACAYRLVKTRFTLDGWEIDRYSGLLRGLYVVEREFTHKNEDLDFPPWLDTRDLVEVTDYVTNYDLARLAGLLEGLPTVPPLVPLLTQREPLVVLTGGPCSGKSTCLAAIKQAPDTRFHCLPETATIVIRDIGTLPPANNDFRMRQFQQQVYLIQRSLETLGSIQAKLTGHQGILLDRGTVDAVAYMPGGARDFEKTCNTSVAHEYQRYAAVICLAVPPYEIYQQFRGNNPARSESYALAEELDMRIRRAWQDHPNFHYVDDSDWETKMRHVRNLATSYLV